MKLSPDKLKGKNLSLELFAYSIQLSIRDGISAKQLGVWTKLGSLDTS